MVMTNLNRNDLRHMAEQRLLLCAARSRLFVLKAFPTKGFEIVIGQTPYLQGHAMLHANTAPVFPVGTEPGR